MKIVICKKGTKEFVEKILESWSPDHSFKCLSTKYTEDFGKAKIFDKLPMSSCGGWWKDHSVKYIEK